MKFTCLESNRAVRTNVYDPTGEAMTVDDIVDLLNDCERLRLYERACESMAAQFVHPRMTAEQLANQQLGEA